MTSIEKQISVLHELQFKCVENGFYGDIELAEKSLEKQIPKLVGKYEECPNCHNDIRRVGTNEDRPRCCTECGQALKYG